jgi:uncharacterized damage-inducible protein DinB
MIDMIQSLFQHQEWADRELLAVVWTHRKAAEDDRLRATLHHIATVQRAFLSLFLARPFDIAKEIEVPASLETVEALFHDAHRAGLSFVAGLKEPDLARVIEMPWIPGARPTLAQAIMQVIMHSQNHRGQCLSRLRELGATPPTLDFIRWVRDRPGLNSDRSVV